jgi:N-acetylneuraminic acid mutarotase
LGDPRARDFSSDGQFSGLDRAEMIVWGGGSQSVWLGDGGRYDLQSNSWRPTSNAGAPSPRWFHGAVWTGREMLVWGGRANFFQSNAYNDGGRYDPTNDTWTAISTAAAPAPRSQFATVWTGTEMLVWGGWALDENTTRGDGAAYNPATDSWRTISNVNAPSSRVEPTAVWTGSEMIIFGGMDATGGGAPGWVTRNTGARYNPQTDTWTPLATEGAPSITAHTAVWTGTDMIVWGGRYLPANTPLNTGARYNLAENKWYPIATPNLGVRIYHSAVWSGSEMLVWGGGGPNNLFNDGARYNPTSDAWSPITQENAPQARHFWRPDLGIWTGRGLLFYGGSYYPQEVDSTAYYVPGRTDGPPEIWAQPRSLTTVEGENVSFSVSADGAQPLSYQWSHNGSVITDATSSILRIDGVERSDAGRYSVTVSNSAGIASSSDAELRIVDVPIISNISPRIGPTEQS